MMTQGSVILPGLVIFVFFIFFLSPLIRSLPAVVSRLPSYNAELNWEAISALLGSLLTIFLGILALVQYLQDKLLDREMQRNEIYQALELASIEHFQMEIENRQLITKFWKGDVKLKELDDSSQYAAMEYFCKILNLFEMATEFRKKEIAHPEIYATWLAWMEEVCQTHLFRELWEEDALYRHYTPEFAVYNAKEFRPL